MFIAALFLIKSLEARQKEKKEGKYRYVSMGVKKCNILIASVNLIALGHSYYFQAFK